MPASFSRIWPWLFAVLIILIAYRRFRRNFGRQLLSPTRMTVRVVILIVLAAALAPSGLRGAGFALAEISGVAAGIALALWGASRTRFVRDGERLFYIPHTYTGIAVSALLLGRIFYRIAATYAAGGFPGTDNPSLDLRASMVKTPLTLGLIFVLIGYYVCYYSRVIWKSKRITPADLEASTTHSGSAA
jgi:hypothetical protein